MKKILTTPWQLYPLILLLLLLLLTYSVDYSSITTLKLHFIFSGLFLMYLGLVHNANIHDTVVKYYNKGDVMKTSPLTVGLISVGLFLLFKSTL